MGEREFYTGVLLPRFWRDLRHCSLGVRALAAYLITGPHNGQVPGLSVVGMGTLADELDLDHPTFAALWQQLPVGLVEYDQRHRVLRVPGLPRHCHKPNHHVLISWWRHWKAVPESPLKYAHIESLRCTIESSESGLVYDTFEKTFGSVVFNHTPNHSGNHSPHGYPNHSVSVSVSASDPDPDLALPLLQRVPSAQPTQTGMAPVPLPAWVSAVAAPTPAPLQLTAQGGADAKPEREHPRAAARRELASYLEWFNRKFCTRFGEREEFLKSVAACLARKYTQQDLRAVALNRRDAWTGTDKAEYLTPATLLRPSCIDKYIDTARAKLGMEDGNAA